MAIPYKSFVYSAPFFFVVGPEEIPFHIHEDLVVQHSDVLAKHVRGGMLETREKRSALPEIDPQTFERFIEFAYTGDYTVPDPVIAAEPADVTENGGGGEEDNNPVSCQKVKAAQAHLELNQASWGADEETASFSFGKSGGKPKKPHKPNKWLGSPGDDEVSHVRSITDKRVQMLSTFASKASVAKKEPWEPRLNDDAREDYTEVFLCHARLYVFSDHFEIESLMHLVLQKLRLTLSRFTQWPERVPDVVELIRYTYAHTVDHESGSDKLRSLVMEYLGCHIESISRDKGFRETLREGGSIAIDVVDKILH